MGAVQRCCGAGRQEGLPCFAGGAPRLLPAEHPSSVPGQYQTLTNPLLHTAAAGTNLKLLLRREATEPGCGRRALSRWGGQWGGGWCPSPPPAKAEQPCWSISPAASPVQSRHGTRTDLSRFSFQFCSPRSPPGHLRPRGGSSRASSRSRSCRCPRCGQAAT